MSDTLELEQLTENFYRHEFVCKGRDCCGGSAPIDARLVSALQEFREILDAPLVINSGFRCNTHNNSIGSDNTSQHVRGTAADIGQVAGYSIVEMAGLAELVEDFRNGGIGMYNTFLHLDVRTDNPARWDSRT